MVPVLITYETFQLIENSSTYKANNIRVAVVNQDRPTQQNNRTWDVGGKLINRLRDEQQRDVHWKFLSAGAAKRELNNGTVDMMVTIPADLSFNASTALSPSPRMSTIKIKMAKRNNFLSVQVNQQIAAGVKEKVTKDIQAVYNKQLLNDIKGLGSQMKTASKGSSQINGNVLSIKSGKISVSRDLDGLVQQMLVFQTGSKAVDDQIAESSSKLSNQVNNNAEKLNQNLDSNSQQFDQQLGSSQQLMGKQINSAAAQVNGRIDTIASGIDTLAVNNKKINLNVSNLQAQSGVMGTGLQNLSATTKAANGTVDDYTNQLGSLYQQIDSNSASLGKLAQATDSDVATINQAQAFIKNAGSLITKVLVLKGAKLDQLDSEKTTQDDLKKATGNIDDETKQIDDHNQQALQQLNDLQNDDTIDADTKANLNKYLDPVKKNLNDNKDALKLINQNTGTINDKLSGLNEDIDKINDLLPKIDDLTKEKLVDQKSIDEINDLVKTLPQTVTTLNGFQTASAQAQQTAQTGKEMANQSARIKQSFGGVGNNLAKLNDNYHGLNDGVTTLKTSSDEAVSQGNDLNTNQVNVQDNQKQTVNDLTDSNDQENQKLTGGLQAATEQLSNNLNQYQENSDFADPLNAQTAAGRSENADRLEAGTNAAKDISKRAADNDNKIHGSLADLLNNNARLYQMLNRDSGKVMRVNAGQRNVNKMINPVNNTISGKGYGAALNKLFAPTIISIALYVGAILTYAAKLYLRRHGKKSFNDKKAMAVAVVQALGVVVFSVLFKVNPNNFGLFAFNILFISLSFTVIALILNRMMGTNGLILMVILLAVQALISNNIVPTSALGIFNKIAWLLPLTYAVNALNDAINAVYFGAGQLLSLIGLGIYPVILGVAMLLLEFKKKRNQLATD
ncbi:hypothetical protein FC87_GL000865 [Fructilactobacillus florum DSM 22689 = JCM 16035]|uniref:Phage infection protein n=1 Tax=Fructilactobacillus florum DSM 22689 = JCM 16035 TaxID=1423745 RepID=A0A0R2CST9_9LACO|nr:hypothetical protein FC87_GL000865 [Fructilactobacillus florum DSM 22689 = JCM 16035]